MNVSTEEKKIRVVEVLDEYRIVINRGSDDGIKDGYRFIIYDLGNEIFDPDTGESLGRIENVQGIGKVTHLQPKIATLTSDQYIQDKPTVTTKRTSSDTTQHYTGLQLPKTTTEEIAVPPLRKVSFAPGIIGALAKYIP